MYAWRGGAGEVDGAILAGSLYLGAGAGQWTTGAGWRGVEAQAGPGGQ